MSNTNQSNMAFQGGNCSLQSRLREVRSKIFDINKKINDLEANVIFLMVCPDLVDYSPAENNNYQEIGAGNADTQQLVTNNSAYYRWEPTFMTNPSELHTQIAECMSTKYDLLIEQKEVVGVLDFEEKTKVTLRIKESCSKEHHQV